LIPLPCCPPAQDSSGEHELKSLAAAWPDRITEIGVREGEWMLRMDGEWYAWAHGRILPEAERSRWEDFSPFRFYAYPLSLPPLVPLDAETQARLRQYVRDAEEHPTQRGFPREASRGRLTRGDRGASGKGTGSGFHGEGARKAA